MGTLPRNKVSRMPCARLRWSRPSFHHATLALTGCWSTRDDLDRPVLDADMPGPDAPGVSPVRRCAPFAAGLQAIGQSPPVSTSDRDAARSILLVWLGGGPSHLDLFDPKPNAPAEYRGTAGHDRDENAGRAVHGAGAPAGGAERSVCAHPLERQLRRRSPRGRLDRVDRWRAPPSSRGSIRPISARSSARRRRAGDLPPFISLARGPIGDGVGPVQGSGGGTWGKGYNPFLIGCSETGELEYLQPAPDRGA